MINKSEKLIGHIVIQTLPQDYPLSRTELQQSDDTSHCLDIHLITDDKNIVNFSAARLLNSYTNWFTIYRHRHPPAPPLAPHTSIPSPTRKLDALLSSGESRWRHIQIAEGDRERGWNKTRSIASWSRTTSLDVNLNSIKTATFHKEIETAKEARVG